MKRFILLFSFVLGTLVLTTADAKDTKSKDEKLTILRKSDLDCKPDPNVNFAPDGSSFPQPFNSKSGDPIEQSRYEPAVSTGYYFVDSKENVAEIWHPEPEFVDTLFEEANWRRVIKGPKTWQTSGARIDIGDDGRPREGYRYFHNPNQSFDPTDPNYVNNDPYDSQIMP